LKKYLAEKAEFVEIDKIPGRFSNSVIYAADLLDRTSKTVRHDSQKLAALIQSIFSHGQRVNPAS
jgi:hypothetical protein